MKKLLFILAVIPSLTFASGTFQVKPGYFVKAGKLGGQVGLSIWEPVTGRLHFSQWLGLGVQPRFQDQSVTFAVSESAFGMWFGRIGVDLGYRFTHADQNVGELISEHGVYLKASYKLW